MCEKYLSLFISIPLLIILLTNTVYTVCETQCELSPIGPLSLCDYLRENLRIKRILFEQMVI